MKPNVRNMIESQVEKSKEKLRAAESLYREGFFDDAISRAYYSMFHVASAVLMSEEITAESHSALKTMFGLHFIKSGRIDRKYGRWLSKAKDARENGDYDIFTDFQEEDAKETIDEATAFLCEMKRYLRETHSIECR